MRVLRTLFWSLAIVAAFFAAMRLAPVHSPNSMWSSSNWSSPIWNGPAAAASSYTADEQNSMDVDTNASADQTPQRPKIRTLSRFSFVDLTLFCCACLLTIVRMLSFLYIVISPYISNIFNIILCNENNNSHEGAERTKEGPP